LVEQWSQRVEEILDGDHAVVLAYATPAEGVVLAPVSNFGMNDRAGGIVTANTSVEAWKKLERIGSNPHVSIAFHTRAHATHGRPEYVLVQGRASLQPPLADYPTSVLEHWERIEPWRNLGPLWRRWLRIYALRVEIRIEVERVVVWPDLACRGALEVEGTPLPAEAPLSQNEPAKGTSPRINHTRAARRARRLPNALLGWIGADGWFSHGVTGQRQMIFTGWMESGSSAFTVTYSPHTLAAYRMPSSRLVYRVVVGLSTRLRYREAQRNRKHAKGPAPRGLSDQRR
jgi:hypothetical protein